MLTLYLIRHKPTGKYLPVTKYNRGGSHTEPMSVLAANPRIFYSKKAAISALAAWLKGKPATRNYFIDENAEEFLTILPQPHRIKSKMEIVEMTLVPKE